MGWVAAAVAVVGAYAKSQSDKKAAKQAKKDSGEMTEAEARLARENSQFENEQAYYYQQLEKKERSRGLDEFRKFSTVQNFAPDYVNTNTGPVVPTKPGFDQGVYAPPVAQPGGGGGGGGGLAGLLKKPIEVHKKIAKGLF